MLDLTNKQLRHAKWYLRHKKKIHSIFVLALIFLNVILITIIVYQTFLYFSSKEEHLQNMQELTENKIDFLSLHQRFSPEFIVTDTLTVIRSDPRKSQYDFIITAFNPNPDWRAVVEYYFSGDGFETSFESSFIDPGEKKYFFILGAHVVSEIKDAQFLISSISWRRVRSAQKESLSILDQLEIENVELKYLKSESDSLILPQISFKVKNNSIYDFWETRFIVALEKDLNLVGLDVLSLDNWRANEEKILNLAWPLIPKFSHIVVKPEIDVLNPDVFISPL